MILCGDNQSQIETGITTDDVIAKVKAIYLNEIRYEGVVGNKNKTFYLFRLKLKRIFKPHINRIKRVIKDPSLIGRKFKK